MNQSLHNDPLRKCESRPARRALCDQTIWRKATRPAPRPFENLLRFALIVRGLLARNHLRFRTHQSSLASTVVGRKEQLLKRSARQPRGSRSRGHVTCCAIASVPETRRFRLNSFCRENLSLGLYAMPPSRMETTIDDTLASSPSRTASGRIGSAAPAGSRTITWRSVVARR